MECRRNTEDTVVGSRFTRQATTVFQRTGTDDNLRCVGESDRWKSKEQMKEWSLDVVKAPKKEHGFSLCEVGRHLKNTEEEQRVV